ncbi:MAG: diguanylate cyclase [Betaproteobacteria bacterium]|nr:MAG: diguanylate cyclase [Betaproteobacteria bacterium]
MKDDSGQIRTAQLLEVDERLVLAALPAEASDKNTASAPAELARSSQRDALTDTPNRTVMLDRLNQSISMAHRRSVHTAVLILDLDRFKEVNDTFGHSAGDRVLRQVASRLKAAVRDSDTVSRHGGDEFVILLTEISNATAVARIVDKVRSALAVPMHIGEQAIHLSASIGTAVYPEDGEDAQTLIDRADAAMHLGKRKTGKLDARRLDLGSEAPPVDAPRRGAASFARGRAGHSQDPFRQLREANEELVLAALTAQELQAAAEATLHRQIASLAILTHELRNVLAPIQTAANLLKQIRNMREPLLPRLQAVIERQTEHMGRLVGDLLDGSRASTGRFRLERCLVELTSVIAQALDSCRWAFDLRRQQVAIHLPSGPLRICGDPVRLVQVFVNLLDNASKYTLEGGEIEIDVARCGQMVEVIVSDNGIGISADVLPHVFDLFVRDAPVRGIRSDGLGIGLAVVRELVEAHGGTVTAESAGRALGSKFIVALPMVDSGAVDTTP